jgi:hypothetical protein
MSNLSALTLLTLFNLVALAHFISTTIAPSRANTLLRQSLAALCMLLSLSAFALALLIHQPGISVATITIVGCVNLLMLLSILARRLQGPSSLDDLRPLSGLARLYFTGESGEHPAVLPALPPDQPTLALPMPSARSVRPASVRTTSRPLPPEELAKAPARPRHQTSARMLAIRPKPRPQSLVHLTPRRSYSVPHRPNRIVATTDSLPCTAAPASALNILASPPARKGRFAALAPRIRLVTYIAHNESVLPLIFNEPDPAWQTTLGRLTALARSA